MFDLKKTVAGLTIMTGMAGAVPAWADDGIVRHSAGKFPIASSIEVPAGASTIYLSGMGAPVQDKKADPHTLAAYGDTQAQTFAALRRIQDELKKLGLGMGDVVQMHIYMVDDPKLGKLDFDGMMKAYTQFYGTDKQPVLPVRSAFGVARLANPGWLVEIEVTAARMPLK
ncbi:RidA family protein [Komagataeibacter oboediens]|uniref:RidA family protein n=1 Tax=Komagataeibacter oboediens TaxID=65958 RepID=UPI00200D31E7|nr:RidA family protein [Komagataeibacter oboediens]MCK9821632.1 RidA family protein [Komagataeibacter oboediens]